MAVQGTDRSVRESVVVGAPIEKAFHAFTAGMAEWWPPEHHIIDAPLAEMVFEPWVGGRIVDRGTDGSECSWARVLVYEPHSRVVFSWDINLYWELETDHEKTSEIEILFVAESPQRTRVELEHRNLERHGDGWEKMRDAVGSSNGWRGGLELFSAHVSG